MSSCAPVSEGKKVALSQRHRSPSRPASPVTGSAQSWLSGWFCVDVLLAKTQAKSLIWGDGALGENDSHTPALEGIRNMVQQQGGTAVGREGRIESPRHLFENRAATVGLYWWLLSWKRRFQGTKRGEARTSGFLVTISGQGSFSVGQSHGRVLGLGSACLSCLLKASWCSLFSSIRAVGKGI